MLSVCLLVYFGMPETIFIKSGTRIIAQEPISTAYTRHSSQLHVYLCMSFPNATRGLEPISYRGVLLSTLLHAIVYVFTQFAKCTGTDCKYIFLIPFYLQAVQIHLANVVKLLEA
jgi:hypothetical protein